MIPRQTGAALIGAMVWLAAATGGVAQIGPGISPDVINASGPLSSQQLQQVTTYAEHWMGRLTGEATDEEVVRARDMVMEPVKMSGSAVFKRAYASAVSPRIVSGLSSERLIVRLNLMIASASLEDASVLAVVKAGLVDANAGVRYWAAKAAGTLSRATQPGDDSRPMLAAEEQNQLVALLTGRMEEESSEPVVQQVLLALGDLRTPKAALALLATLDQRVASYADKASTAPEAERVALRNLVNRVLTDEARNLPVSDEVRRGLVRAAWRYSALAAGALDRNLAAGSALEQYWVLIADCDRVLRWGVKKLAPQTTQPQALTTAINNRLTAEVILKLGEWQAILTSPPIGMNAAELEVKAAVQAPVPSAANNP